MAFGLLVMLWNGQGWVRLRHKTYFLLGLGSGTDVKRSLNKATLSLVTYVAEAAHVSQLNSSKISEVYVGLCTTTYKHNLKTNRSWLLDMNPGH